MGTKTIIFSSENLLSLLTHYSNGLVDLDAKLLQVGIGANLQREIGLLVESNQWKDKKLPNQDVYGPLYLSYEGKRTMKWGRKDDEVTWFDADNFNPVQ